MRYITANDVKEHLEFVRTQDGVDVYRVKTTGQELYVGRAFPKRADINSRHTELYQQACKLTEGLLVLGNDPPGRLRRRDKKRLENAVALLVEVVELNPENWPAMWNRVRFQESIDKEGVDGWPLVVFYLDRGMPFSR